MNRKVLLMLIAIYICAGQYLPAASAQITINIPGIPKFPKTKKVKAESVDVVPDPKDAPSADQTTRGVGNTTTGPVKARHEDPPGLIYELEKIEKMRIAVDKYASDWPYWPEITYKNFVLFAVSKLAREGYLKQLETVLQSEQSRAKLNQALDALAASAAKKLPIYKPADQTFSVRSPANESLILQKLKNRLGSSVTLTTYKSGFQGSWQIYQDNTGLPQYRFMRGYIYAKNPADDHPYCHLYYVSVSQQYAGGGTYASSYATFEDDFVFGCP
jgi:hypothetical protein